MVDITNIGHFFVIKKAKYLKNSWKMGSYDSIMLITSSKRRERLLYEIQLLNVSVKFSAKF